jgi:hypothetical protein
VNAENRRLDSGDDRNVVLTGPPRSGTTLACRLLNKLPDTVALHEPIPPRRFAGLDGEDAVLDGVEQFFRRMRRMILTRKVAISKHAGGEVPDNVYEGTSPDAGPRPHAGKEKGEIPVRKDLERNFYLVVKHPAMFTALLPVLAKRFGAYAIVRNPLSILASWNSVDHNVRDGHAPAAERYDGELKQALAATDDRTERQLRLLSWFYERYDGTLPDGHVVRYEDIVATGGGALAAIVPGAGTLDEPLESKNLNEAYGRDGMRVLGERLLEREGAYWRFYGRESVEELLYEIS